MSCLGRLLGRLLGPRPAAADCSAAHDMSLSSPQCPLRPSPSNMSAMFYDVQDVVIGTRRLSKNIQLLEVRKLLKTICLFVSILGEDYL